MLLHTQLSVSPCYCTHSFGACPCYCTHSSVHAHVTAHTAQCEPMLLHTQLSVNPCYCTHSSVHAHVTAHTAQCTPMLLHTQLPCTPMLLHTQVPVSLCSKHRPGIPYTVCVVWLHNTKEPSCNNSSDSNLWHVMNWSAFLHTQHSLLLQKHNCLIMKTESLKCLYHHSSACKNQIATSWIILC